MPILGLHRNAIVSQLVPEQWNFNGPVNAIALERNANGTTTGKIYVGGNYNRYNGSTANLIIRLNPNGTVDSSFNTGTGFTGGEVRAIVPVSGSTSIYVGGDFLGYSGSTCHKVIRINSNGTRDLTFNPGTSTTGNIYAIALASGSDKLYVGGDFTIYRGSSINRIARVNSNGTLDTSFNVGMGATRTGGVANTVFGILPVTQSAGQIYTVGSFNLYSGSQVNGIARINSNGTLVGTGSFNTGVGNAVGFNETPYVIKQVFNSTSVYVGGNFTTYSGSTSINRIVRINSNGTRDTSFNMGTTGFNNIVYSIADTLDGSGDIYVGGSFTTYSGSSANRIVRVRSNGTINTSVSFGTGFNNSVLAIEPTSSNQVYMGGNFTSYKGNTYNYIIKLTS